MIGEIAHRRLGQAGDHGEHGQREAELDIADAELAFEEREQHRQHQQMEMADPMGRRNRDQRAQLLVRSLLVAVRPECRPSPIPLILMAKLSALLAICP